jgi:hypothetical protein
MPNSHIEKKYVEKTKKIDNKIWPVNFEKLR